MNTTIIMKGEIAKAAREESSNAFLELYASDIARFDKKLTQQWQTYYAAISQGHSPREIADRCQCALNTAKKWNASVPCHREHYVMIGCCFGLSPDEVSGLMSRYGGFARLRTDNPDDIRSIRLLELMRDSMKENNAGAFDLPSTYESLGNAYYAEADRILSNGLWAESREAMAEGSRLIRPDPAFYAMMEKSRKTIGSSYRSVSKALTERLKNIGFKSNSAFYSKMNMSSSMQRIFSCMSSCIGSDGQTYAAQDKFTLRPMPRRRQLITFCLYLGMPMNDINSILKKANMEELCPRDPFEAALLFVLQQLYNKDRRFAGREMQGKENLAIQEDLQYLHNTGYFGLFGYVYSRLSQGELADFLNRMDVDIGKAMCL